VIRLTYATGATKYESKKAGMVSKYRLDPDRYREGLSRAGQAPGPMTSAAYANSASYAVENYRAAMSAVTGAYWESRAKAGVAR
jgi:hypothetical protein